VTGRSRSALATECAHETTELIASAQNVAREIELRRDFFLSRLEGTVDERDLRDLTEMTTNEGARIDRCAGCGVLVRADPIRTPKRFACDEYDARTLRMLHELHVETFVNKPDIHDLLPEGSRVLEIGSYVGGFLEAARRWGWNATGVDIGRDTTEFAAAKGYDVTTERFERLEFPAESFDAVFIWSCFEQMTNPAEVLPRVREVSKPGAPLVLYVPDAAVYRDAQRAFDAGEPREEISPIVQQLAYNNLLGFPHHFGYDKAALKGLVTRFGFVEVSSKNVPAIRPLRDRLTKAAREEEERVAPAWLEVVFAVDDAT
jgi:ubiquinone/menaquinone biosynthesis C-methylase UbiE